MSIEAFVKRFSGGGLGPPLHFYVNKEGNSGATLRFDAEKHKYFLVKEDGSLEAQYGVTNACHIIDKSQPLMAWAVKMMHDQFMRTMPTRMLPDGTTVTKEITDMELRAILDEAKSAHKNRVNDAADIGHIAHQCIEDSIKHALESTNGIVLQLVNYPTDEKAASCCDAALKWMRSHNVRWIATERKIYSRAHKYAGTLDGLCVIDSCSDYLCCEVTEKTPAFKDRLVVCDWKSCNSLHVEMRYQTAAYLQALLEEYGQQASE